MHHKLTAFVNETYQAIKKICNPFLQQAHLGAFIYEKAIGHNKKCTLATHRDWHEAFYEQAFHETAALFIATPNLINQGIFVPALQGIEGIENQHEAEYKRDKFNLGHAYVYFHGSSERFIFIGQADDHRILNLGMSHNIEKIRRFIMYFKYAAEDYIIECQKHPLILSAPLGNHVFDFAKPTDTEETIPITKLYLSDRNGIEYSLTKRQAQCLYLIIQKQKYKSIAHQLNISVSTIEYHLNNLKQVFNLEHKAELIEHFGHNLEILKLSMS